MRKKLPLHFRVCYLAHGKLIELNIMSVEFCFLGEERVGHAQFPVSRQTAQL